MSYYIPFAVSKNKNSKIVSLKYKLCWSIAYALQIIIEYHFQF